MRKKRKSRAEAIHSRISNDWFIDYLSILFALPFPATLAGLPEGFGSSLFTRDRRPDPSRKRERKRSLKRRKKSSQWKSKNSNHVLLRWSCLMLMMIRRTFKSIWFEPSFRNIDGRINKEIFIQMTRRSSPVWRRKKARRRRRRFSSICFLFLDKKTEVSTMKWEGKNARSR